MTEAAPIAIGAALEALVSARHVTLIRFVLFDLQTLRAYERAAQKLSTSNTTHFRMETLKPLTKSPHQASKEIHEKKSDGRQLEDV